MAVHAGKEGIVKVGASPVAIAEVKEWTLETTGEVVDSTSINTATSNAGWRTFVSTLNSWNGSVSCFWDETDTNGQETLDAGSTVALKLYPEGDTTGDVFFSGNAIVTGITRQAALDGLVEVNFTFQGTGALTQSTV